MSNFNDNSSSYSINDHPNTSSNKIKSGKLSSQHPSGGSKWSSSLNNSTQLRPTNYS